MTIRFVTTCHKEGFEKYGHRLLSGLHNLPLGELYWYTDGFELPSTPGVRAIDNADLPDLQKFKQRYAHYVAPYYHMNVVRFSNKVFAAIDALSGHDDLGVWIDADIVPYAPMSETYLRGLLPPDCYIAMFKRVGTYTETGFWVVDCRHSGHAAFMSAMRDIYMTDAFRDASEWHDAYLTDIVVRNLEKAGVLKSHDLSGAHGRHEHPMATADIARFLDHLKGPERKEIGRSPENSNRILR